MSAESQRIHGITPQRVAGQPRIEQVLARESDITIGIEHHYGFELSIDGILNEIETGEIDYQSLAAEFDEYSQPVVRLVDALLNDAVKRSASDIHFEPEQGFLRIRYRIDGVLRQIRSLHKTYWPAMAVRLKVMAKMNIAETRAPQDGRISLMLSGHQVDFRVSSQPTTHGENIVLRILDRDKGIVPLEELGLHAEDLKTLKLMLARPEGIILVTGPTGSGKTTTLYAALSKINDVQRKIVTIEDPVEYQLRGVNQIQVNSKSGLTFAMGLRSILRHDPDVVLVGEIRDTETATIAIQASLTGHLVFSTLHTNDAAGAITRLMDLGVPAYLISATLIGVLAQRLARTLCPACKTRDEAITRETLDEQEILDVTGLSPAPLLESGRVACSPEPARSTPMSSAPSSPCTPAATWTSPRAPWTCRSTSPRRSSARGRCVATTTRPEAPPARAAPATTCRTTCSASSRSRAS